MATTFQMTIDHFPEILEKNASGLMQRIISKTKMSINADLQLSNATACNFFLQTSAEALVRQFESQLKDALQDIRARQSSGKTGGFGSGLSLDTEGSEEQLAIADMKSTALFAQLCAKGKQHQINGVDAYDAKLFMNAMREAFNKSKFPDGELTSIFPHAIRALDSELINLYSKLDLLAV